MVSTWLTASLALVATASAAPPVPSQLANQFSANFRLHSAAAVVTSSYWIGAYQTDVQAGLKRQVGVTTETTAPTSEDSLVLCNGAPGSGNETAIQFYLSNTTQGCIHVTKPTCPLADPYSIASDATWMRNETVNGVSCDYWQFYSPAYQSEVWAWTMQMPAGSKSPPPLVRFVADRVQHDFTDIVLGPPKADASKIPAPCL